MTKDQFFVNNFNSDSKTTGISKFTNLESMYSRVVNLNENFVSE